MLTLSQYTQKTEYKITEKTNIPVNGFNNLLLYSVDSLIKIFILTTKITDGFGAQRKSRPVERLVSAGYGKGPVHTIFTRPGT